MLAAASLWAGCGGNGAADGADGGGSVFGQGSADEPAASGLAHPEAATKNTTRVTGEHPVERAGAVALAAHPSATTESRPPAVTLVDRGDWAAAISASQLVGGPVRAPILFSDGDQLPEASAEALGRLRPTGHEQLDGAQVIRVATTARPEGLRDTNLEGAGPAAIARAIDRLRTRAVGEPSRSVVVAPLDAPEFAMPAAGWAAKSGDPVLWARQDDLPRETAAAIRSRDEPRIYVLGPDTAISDSVVEELERLGSVTRIEGRDPVLNAIAFARFRDEPFGWGVTDPGHGLVLARVREPLDAAAAAPLSAAGSYGPLLLLSDGERLPAPVRDYLLDIQPGYESDPVRGVYNHAWLMGDVSAISIEWQSHIDSLLEIQPVDAS